MTEVAFDVTKPFGKRNMHEFLAACNQRLGRQAVTGVGADGWLVGNDLTEAEIATICELAGAIDTLDEWEPSNFRKLTIDQVNAKLSEINSQIDAITDLPKAKAVLKKMANYEATLYRIVLCLLKREMNEL